MKKHEKGGSWGRSGGDTVVCVCARGRGHDVILAEGSERRGVWLRGGRLVPQNIAIPGTARTRHGHSSTHPSDDHQALRGVDKVGERLDLGLGCRARGIHGLDGRGLVRCGRVERETGLAARQIEEGHTLNSTSGIYVNK